jgi:hypothetical protein
MQRCSGAGEAGGRGPEAEPQLSVHDVEAETFSSQILGQALQEAARSLAEGSALCQVCESKQGA